MPKDNKCDLCSKDVQTDGSNRNLLVQLVFDILSERLWTSPFTTNFQVFGNFFSDMLNVYMLALNGCYLKYILTT